MQLLKQPTTLKEPVSPIAELTYNQYHELLLMMSSVNKKDWIGTLSKKFGLT